MRLIRNQQTIAEIASEYGVHPSQINKWKKQVLDGVPTIFSGSHDKGKQDGEKLQAELYQQIGQLKVEVDWLKKSWVTSAETKRLLVEADHPAICISRQCELLDLPRSSFYYKPAGISEYNLVLMDMIDQKYTQHPFYGILRMTAWLHDQGHPVNHKRVQRLMQLMDLRAIYPKPRLSRSEDVSEKYPYLLKGLMIRRPNQVWGTDITYIKLKQGFVYLVAIMDWFSRYVISWEVSNSLDTHFCLSALEKALGRGVVPEIFNTDQGVQFTSHSFTERLESAEVKISMDGRGRVFDNIFIERLWRTVKYEDIYLKNYAMVMELEQGLARYFPFYNNERFHQSLDYKTPVQVYYDCQRTTDSDA